MSVIIEIRVEILKKILDNFFTKITSKGIDTLVLNSDLYWSVPEDCLTDLKEVPDLEVGSLNDDVAFLNSLIAEDYDANYLELERLSAVFKALSYDLTRVNE
jgi:hypothetical protein